MEYQMDIEIIGLIMLIASTWVGIGYLNHRISKAFRLLEIFSNDHSEYRNLRLMINRVEEQIVWVKKDLDRLSASLDKRFSLKADAGFVDSLKETKNALEKSLKSGKHVNTTEAFAPKQKRKYTKRKK